MMYNRQVACAIKVNNKVLQEDKDGKVYLPFGSEYSIFVKNLSNKRIRFKVSIDDIDATKDCFVIVNANSSVDLKRFISHDTSTDTGNAFKFIKRTQQIENYKGIGVCDGLVRIECEYEVDQPQMLYSNWTPEKITKINWDNAYNRSSDTPMQTSNIQHMLLTSSAQATYLSDNRNDIGITVPGSIVHQEFSSTAFNANKLEQSVLFVFQLFGKTETNIINTPIVSNHKVKCTTCGRKNKANKFCYECGTSLHII